MPELDLAKANRATSRRLCGSASDLCHSYRNWQKRYHNGWGLAWYLAAEICERFYASHGIVPWVLEHEGLGYYGIGIEELKCANRPGRTLGRLTSAGDVENWIKKPVHCNDRIELIARARRNESLDCLLGEAIQYLELPEQPSEVHIHCRHKRWGASYVLLFRIAALLALKWNNQLRIWNHPIMVSREAAPLDQFSSMPEHPGYFSIKTSKATLIISGDGRVLLPQGVESIWTRYMSGHGISSICAHLEHRLGLTVSNRT